MSLHTLPNELLLLIASPLSTRDLASLILASRHYHSLLTPAFTARARHDHRALHHAAVHGHHDVLQHYLSLGVPPSIADSRNFTALHQAVRRGDAVAVRLLLDHGAAPGAAAGQGGKNTPLLSAVAGGAEEIVRMLLESGADPDPVGGISPMGMVLAVEAHGRRSKGWAESVRAMLVQYGAPKQTVVVDGGRDSTAAVASG